MAKSPMGIKPLHDYVLVVPAKQEEKTASGIILPDAAKEKPQMGEVVAVGPGAYDEHGEKRMPMEVKVGDRVLYKKWGSEEVKMDREEMMLIKQSDIMAIVS